MRTIRGIGVSEGVAIGTAFVLEGASPRIAPSHVGPDEVEAELARLDAAVEGSIEELRAVYTQAEEEMGAEAAKIFLFHMGMLGDSSVIGPIRERITERREGADYAVSRSLRELADKFRAMGDSAFTTKVNDIKDLRERLIAQLQGERLQKLSDLSEDTILVATDLTPSQTAGLNRDKVKGIATDSGGRTSHTAIVARALGLPALVGTGDASGAVEHGETVILDGDRGLLLVEPDEDTLNRYRAYIRQAETYSLGLAELANMPGVTSDGETVRLLGNIEFPDEVDSVARSGGLGVGLYRTEFLFLTGEHERGWSPSEKDHFEAYQRCVNLLHEAAPDPGGPAELTIRTFDLGADKYTQAQEENPERNPALGNRSIRYSLRRLGLFKSQLRAALRASALRPDTVRVKVMFPLVTTMGELRHAKMVVRDVMEDLAEEGFAFDRSIPLGMMVESPSSAIMAGSFAKEVDFFSIGTNDLVQYTLAVDRTNERVADLYRPTHPAVIRLIREVVKAGRRKDVPVSICGEAAGDLEYAVLLLGLGVRTLSATASSLPRLKRLVRSVSIEQCERVARKALTFDSDVEVSAFLRARTRKIVPEAFDGRAVEERV